MNRPLTNHSTGLCKVRFRLELPNLQFWFHLSSSTVHNLFRFSPDFLLPDPISHIPLILVQKSSQLVLLFQFRFPPPGSHIIDSGAEKAAPVMWSAVACQQCMQWSRNRGGRGACAPPFPNIIVGGGQSNMF